ncbi:MAG: hypothetical protein WCA08_05800 [Desulfoferrobacter sp.]
MNGAQRAQCTIGVGGCGKRATCFVVGPESGDGCFAIGPGRFYEWQVRGMVVKKLGPEEFGRLAKRLEAARFGEA